MNDNADKHNYYHS